MLRRSLFTVAAVTPGPGGVTLYTTITPGICNGLTATLLRLVNGERLESTRMVLASRPIVRESTAPL